MRKLQEEQGKNKQGNKWYARSYEETTPVIFKGGVHIKRRKSYSVVLYVASWENYLSLNF